MQDRDYSSIAKKYAQDVCAGRLVACKWVRLAAERFLSDLKTCKKKGFVFDESAVWSACDFMEHLPHVEGQWETPTITLEPWQVFIVANVFGFRWPDGRRRFNTVYIEVGRKNAKSTFTAGMALYGLGMEREIGPQIKCAAPTGRQARIVFDVACKMVNKSTDLKEALELQVFANSIVCGVTDGSMGPINSKASTQDGLNPHWSIIDEFHAHKSRGLYDVLKSARGARKNPMSWYITTAGDDVNGVCYEQRSIVTKILDGIFEADHYFGIIFTLDLGEEGRDGDDPFDESVWVKANPNLGVSVGLKELREYASEARVSPSSQGEFKTKRLNIWISAAAAWLNVDQWRKCGDTSGLTLDDFAGEECWIGVDMSDRDDITAKVYLFWRDDRPYVFTKFYLPREQVEAKAQTVGGHYSAWAEQGHLTLTDGNWISREAIKTDLQADIVKFVVQYIGFDQWGGAQSMAEDIQDDFSGKIIILPKTAKNFTAPALDLEARVKNSLIVHDNNQVMNWMVSNAVVERRVDKTILPKKPSTNSNKKIDGVDALITAMAGFMVIAPSGHNLTGFGLV